MLVRFQLHLFARRSAAEEAVPTFDHKAKAMLIGDADRLAFFGLKRTVPRRQRVEAATKAIGLHNEQISAGERGGGVAVE